MAHKKLGGFERLKALKAKADKQISERKSQISEARKAAAKREASAVDRARRDKKIKALNDKMDLLREDKKRIKSLSVGENFKRGVKSGIKQAVTGIGGGVASKGVKAIKSRVGSKAAKKKIQTKGPEFYRAKRKKK